MEKDDASNMGEVVGRTSKGKQYIIVGGCNKWLYCAGE